MQPTPNHHSDWKKSFFPARALRLFGDVRPGESTQVLLMLANLFLLMVGYYILKSVREAIVGGAELKSYASSAQAICMMGFVPLYSWIASRTHRMKLVMLFLSFFILNIELFVLGDYTGIPYLGFIFFVWLGVFNVAAPAQFWSYANDIYTKPIGERLFPIIAIGAVAGSPLGSLVAKVLFEKGIEPYNMMHLGAGILILHLGLYIVIDIRTRSEKTNHAPAKTESLSGANGFSLLLRNPYTRMIALLLLILNLVNTTGEYILTKSVNELAQHQATLQGLLPNSSEYINFIENFRGRFFSGFYLVVNLVAFVFQALIVSRMMKYIGLKAVLFMLPLVAFGAYGIIAMGAGLALIRFSKTIENATDYSVMNTGKAVLWLPTNRQEKYKAKQAADTFFVRFGDVLSGALVFLGTEIFSLGIRWFAVINIVLICIWLGVTLKVYKNHKLVSSGCADPVTPA